MKDSLPNKKTLGGKRIGLNIDVGVGQIVHEAGFTHIGETSDQKSSVVRVDAGQSSHVFSDFFQKSKGGL